MSLLKRFAFYILCPLAFLAYGAAAIVYPTTRRGGQVCICTGDTAYASSALCTMAALRNHPYDSTEFSSSFEDIPDEGDPLADRIVVRSGSSLPTIVLEVVDAMDRTSTVQDGSVVEQLGLTALPVGSALALESISVAQQSDPSIVITVLSDHSRATNDYLILPNVRISAANLAPWDSVSLLLNVSVRVLGNVTSSADALLWLLLPAIDVRTTEAVGNSTFSSVQHYLRFPRFYNPLVHDSGSFSQLFSIDSIVIGTQLPSITILLTDVFGSVVTHSTTVRVSARYSSGSLTSTLTGTLALPLKNGRASFADLVFSNLTPPRVGLHLVFECDDVRIAPLRSPTLTTLPVAQHNARLAFSDVYAPDDVLDFSPSNIVPSIERSLLARLPPFRVQILDSSGVLDPNNIQGLFIIATARGAVLDEWSSRQPVVGGEALFESLMFTKLKSVDPYIDTVITFAATDLQNPFETPSTVRQILHSRVVRVHREVPQRPAFLRFEPSSFFSPSGTTDVSYPIALANATFPTTRVFVMGADARLFRSALQVGVEVASSGAGVTVGGVVLVMASEGVAVFSDFKLISGDICTVANLSACMPLQLRFSANGVSLLSPRFFLVSAFGVLPQRSIRFEPYSGSYFSSEGQSGFATVRIPIPPIVIEVLRSDGQVDVDADNVTVYAKSSSLALEGSLAVSFRGRAIFTDLLFAESGTDTITFRAETRFGPASLRSGTITVESAFIPSYALTFHPDSFVFAEGQAIPATAGVPIPPIGLAVRNSDYTLADDSFLAVVALCTVPCEGGTHLTVINGHVWFRNISFPHLLSGQLPTITFRAFVPNEIRTSVSLSTSIVSSAMEYVHGKELSTGEVSFFRPDTPSRIELLPYFSSDGLLLRVPPASADEVIDRVGDVVRLYFDNSQQSFSMVSISFRVVDTLGSSIVSNSTVVAQCDSNAVLLGGFASLLTQQHDGHVAFSNLQFNPTPFISGFFTTLTFDVLDHGIKFRVGPVRFEPFAPEGFPEEPIILVEVLAGGASFSIDSWVASLSALMGVDKGRIEILRAREGSSAPKGFAREWAGTRIEFRFLSPTPSTALKISSKELVDYFLTLSSDDCGLVAPLRIRRKLLLTEDRECDLFMLDEQRRASQRCVETEGPSGRCQCHVPMFEALGDRCKSTDQLLSLCATLNRCGDYPAISDPCFELLYLIYLQYFLIGVYTFVALLIAYLVFLWRSGFFLRCLRRRMGDASDGKAPPMQMDSDNMTFQHMDAIV